MPDVPIFEIELKKLNLILILFTYPRENAAKF